MEFIVFWIGICAMIVVGTICFTIYKIFKMVKESLDK